METTNRTEQINVRMTPKELKELDKLRRKEHRSRSEMIRYLFLMELERQADQKADRQRGT